MNTIVDAPELPLLEWVNTEQPPSLKALRGRVVMLFFWTYDSVNCTNVLPDLDFLQNKYHDGLSIIGMHAPKFTAQRDSETLLKAVNRCRIRHPVANDAGFMAWQAYGVQSWPTMALIDATGRLRALLPGEGRRDEADALIGQLLDEAAVEDIRVYESGTAVNHAEPESPLCFPGKLLVTETGLWIADSGHHRIIECDHGGRILRQIGSGNPGYWDGNGRDAGFNDPQGLALFRDVLYVADSGNHCVRRVRLLKEEVDTVAGVGSLGHDVPYDYLEATKVGMSAPTDLALIGDNLYIAVAGQNQIWRLDPVRNRLSIVAGNGQLGLADGDGTMASLAQPSGLGVVGQQLVVADAEASAIRLVRLLDRRVSTLVGTDLYEFGDASGKREKARLQHPMAVCADTRGLIFIADTYNNKIKVLNMRSGELRALNIPQRFLHPTGLALGPDALWVANTNAHAIVRLSLGTGKATRVEIRE